MERPYAQLLRMTCALCCTSHAFERCDLETRPTTAFPSRNMSSSVGLLVSAVSFFCLIFIVKPDVSLEPSGNVTVCVNSSIILTCLTTKGTLVWESATFNQFFNAPKPPVIEGSFVLEVISAQERAVGNMTLLTVKSTATLSKFQIGLNGTVVRCGEFMNPNLQQAILIDAGPPNAPEVTLTKTSNKHKQSNATFTVTWSQSICAVQYVVTIINSSNDRVYPNITTNDTNTTTVTLPTGVEFCVTLLAVDSIGRRGPNTIPVCYYADAIITNETITQTITNEDKIPSPTVTQPPAMMGGVNVAAAVAIPVVLVIGVVLIGVIGIIIWIRKQGVHRHKVKQNYICQVFYHEEKKDNRWKIIFVFFSEQYMDKVQQYYQNANHGEYVDFKSFTDQTVQVTHDENDMTKWTITSSEPCQVNKADVQKYSGEGKPPSCEMTLTFVKENRVSFAANVTGIQPRRTLTIKRGIKDDGECCLCQVFYQKTKKEKENCWKATIAFFPKDKHEEVKVHYQNVNAGQVEQIEFVKGNKVGVDTPRKTDEWKFQRKNRFRKNVNMDRVMKYTTGEPPNCVIEIKPAERSGNPSCLDKKVTLTGLKEEKSIQLKRAVESQL